MTVNIIFSIHFVGPIADTLQKLPVKIIKHGVCKNNMKGYKQVRVFNALHPDKNICAGGELGEILMKFNQITIIFDSYN